MFGVGWISRLLVTRLCISRSPWLPVDSLSDHQGPNYRHAAPRSPPSAYTSDITGISFQRVEKGTDCDMTLWQYNEVGWIREIIPNLENWYQFNKGIQGDFREFNEESSTEPDSEVQGNAKWMNIRWNRVECGINVALRKISRMLTIWRFKSIDTHR